MEEKKIVIGGETSVICWLSNYNLMEIRTHEVEVALTRGSGSFVQR